MTLSFGCIVKFPALSLICTDIASPEPFSISIESSAGSEKMAWGGPKRSDICTTVSGLTLIKRVGCRELRKPERDFSACAKFKIAFLFLSSLTRGDLGPSKSLSPLPTRQKTHFKRLLFAYTIETYFHIEILK